METRSTADPLGVLAPLADAIAERIWFRLQEKIAMRDSQLLSIPQAAKRLSISVAKLRSMVRSGEVPPKIVRHIGRRVMLVASELDLWISAQR